MVNRFAGGKHQREYSFAPLGLGSVKLSQPTAYAVGCNLPPLRGFILKPPLSWRLSYLVAGLCQFRCVFFGVGGTAQFAGNPLVGDGQTLNQRNGRLPSENALGAGVFAVTSANALRPSEVVPDLDFLSGGVGDHLHQLIDR